MISQLDDAERPTEPVASIDARRASNAPVPWSPATSVYSTGFDTLPAMTRGLIALAAIWVGMALFVAAFAFSFETTFVQILLAVVGGWLLASGTAYVVADAPSRSGDVARETAHGFA